MDWFYVVFGLVGLLALLSAVYEWTWVWKLAQGGYLPRQIGWRKTRMLYLFGGMGVLGAAIALFMQTLFANDSLLIFILGFLVSGLIMMVLFNSRKNQSFIDFIFNKDK